MIGIDSPVNIDSFTMADPFNSMQSQGTVQSFCTSIRSPGTMSFELYFTLVEIRSYGIIRDSFSILIPFYFLYKFSVVFYADISLSRLKLVFVSLKLMIIDIKEESSITIA